MTNWKFDLELDVYQTWDAIAFKFGKLGRVGDRVRSWQG